MTKILLVDRSGRGHAYSELFSRTNPESVVYYAPGCGAVTTERVIAVPELSLAEAGPMVEFATKKKIDLVFVANATALATGFVDEFRDAGFPVIGPDRNASRLESSKIFGKEFCVRHNIRVAEFAHFDRPEAALQYVRNLSYQVVVKADGLCGGNGSFVCDTVADAEAAIHTLMVERKFEQAGDRVVIERRLFGTEISVFALLDRSGALLLPMALDYKKSDDGNTGITCGGMGAVSPHPLENPELADLVHAQLLDPIYKAIQKEGLNYAGVIYLGCMKVEQKLYLLEINVRMGEPEAEVTLSRIESDFLRICENITRGKLSETRLELNSLSFCDIVAAQGRTRQIVKGKNKGWYAGWPYGRYGKYYPITGLDKLNLQQCKLFLGEAFLHPQKGLVSDGARVLHVVGIGKSHQEAVDHAYANIQHVKFNGIRYRSDIGKILPWQTAVGMERHRHEAELISVQTSAAGGRTRE